MKKTESEDKCGECHGTGMVGHSCTGGLCLIVHYCDKCEGTGKAVGKEEKNTHQ